MIFVHHITPLFLLKNMNALIYLPLVTLDFLFLVALKAIYCLSYHSAIAFGISVSDVLVPMCYSC